MLSIIKLSPKCNFTAEDKYWDIDYDRIRLDGVVRLPRRAYAK